MTLPLTVYGADEASKCTIAEVQASEILFKIKNGIPVEYDHVIIKGDLDLSKLDLPITHINRTRYEIDYLGLSETQKIVTSHIRINDSVFDGFVDFGNMVLNNTIDLSHSNFTKYAYFGGVTFNNNKTRPIEVPIRNEADMKKRVRGSGMGHWTVSLSYSITNCANFNGATFSGSAYFDRAIFLGDANFVGVTFSELAGFNGAAFCMGADFSKAISNGINIPSILLSPEIIDGIDFTGANFNESATFEGVVFKSAKFNKAKFSDFTNFNGAHFDDGDFSGAAFNHANFRGSSLNKARFEESIFNYAEFPEVNSGDVDFSGAKFGNADFNGATFYNVNFNGADFSSATNMDFSFAVNFAGARFIKHANFNGTKFDNVDFSRATFSDADFSEVAIGKNVDLKKSEFAGYFLGWDNIKKAIIYDDTVYLGLIKNFKEHGQFNEADDCYFQYRFEKLQHNAKNNWFKWNNTLKFPKDMLLFLWDILSLSVFGYGVKWEYTIGFALIIISIFGLWFSRYMDGDLFKALSISAFVLFSLPSDWWGKQKSDFSEFMSKHMKSAIIERLIGWGLLILLLNTLSRVIIRY